MAFDPMHMGCALYTALQPCARPSALGEISPGIRLSPMSSYVCLILPRYVPLYLGCMHDVVAHSFQPRLPILRPATSRRYVSRQKVSRQCMSFGSEGPWSKTPIVSLLLLWLPWADRIAILLIPLDICFGAVPVESNRHGKIQNTVEVYGHYYETPLSLLPAGFAQVSCTCPSCFDR